MFLDERVDVSGIEIENVVAVRYECTQKGSGNKWPSMREFKVSTTPETGVEFTKEVIRTQDGWAPYQGEESNLIDENTQTSIWYNVRQNGNPANTTIKGDYVGVKLSQPITLGKIDILQGKNGNDGDYFKNVKLQYSVNGTDWKDIPGVEPFKNTRHIQVDLSDKNIEAQYVRLENQENQESWIAFREFDVDARYVRLINKTDAKKTFDIQKLSLKTFEIYEKSLVADQTTFAIGEAASNPATNLFDGDRTTQVIYQGSQNQGAKFVYDLGQTIDLKTLKVVCRDSEIDFPHHAKISVSTDGQKWTDVMTIGNQDKENEGEASNEDNINDVLPLHETSYNAKLEENINQKARFIKFEITRTKVGSDKWVRFQEFEINGGEYMPTVNDPTFESDCLDTRNGKYAYMVDADLSTAFVPAKETGTLNYTVSDNNNVNVIKIIQGADAISNATVKARTLKNPDKWITLGTLAQTVNEFVLEKDTVLLDVKLEWKNVTPSITELVFAKTDTVNVDKAELKKLLDNKEDTSSWTTDSKQAYDAAIAAGQKVYDSEHASKGSVDSAVLAIKNAVADKELKGDMSKLQAALDKALKDSENYTARTWRVYSNAVSAIETAMENADNTSVADVEKLLADLEAAKSALVYNPSAMEECMLAVQAENDFINATDKSIYTEESWNNFVAAKEAVEQLIEKNKTTPVHPSEFKDALKALKDAKEGLTFVPVAPVSKEVLYGLIKTAEGLDAQLYTKDSYQALTEALNAAKAEFDRTDSTEESVKAAVDKLDAAIKALVTRANGEEVKAYINGIELKDASKYTEESYKVYKDAYQKLCGVLDRLDNVSQEEYLKLRNAFETAEANLVEKDAAKPEQPKPDKPQQDQKPDSDDKHEVHTGDTTESSLPMAWLLASVVAVGGILISKKKRVK
jgi:hyaluronoglucosaminidase